MENLNLVRVRDEEDDDNYYCYRPAKPIKVFNFLLNNEDCLIYIGREIKKSKALKTASNYLNWFTQCKDTMTEYFEKRLDEEVGDNWFETIRVLEAGADSDKKSRDGYSVRDLATFSEIPEIEELVCG